MTLTISDIVMAAKKTHGLSLVQTMVLTGALRYARDMAQDDKFDTAKYGLVTETWLRQLQD